MAHEAPVHAESRFENEIVAVLKDTGWTQGDSTQYDKATATYPSVLFAFIQDTQPAALTELQAKGVAAPKLAALVRLAIDSVGLSRALLRGVTVAGVHLVLLYSKPAHALNPAVVRLYKANRLQVVQQLKYSLRYEGSIDLCLFLNGIPVVTAELKSEVNQTVRNAIKQYEEDRNPTGEPLLMVGTGALVHFALDQSEVHMSTGLSGRTTKFLPFNRFSEAGEVNPRLPGPVDHPTCHLWRVTWQPDTLLHIISRFVTQETGPSRLEHPNDRVIFPRYHQWESSSAIIADIQDRGAGERYLVQHSPGSGKSNTIGWTAHEMSELHNESNTRVYSSVLILTDRVVLDNQLSYTASLLQRFAGRAKQAESTGHLIELLTSNCPVVVSTIQKFAHIFKEDVADAFKAKWAALSSKNFGVIIDEAHSSQQGEYHDALKRHLESYKGKNLTYLAFTATPKEETLAMFGREDSSGQRKPFHVYSMYQALTEGFILDVLQNYFPVKSSYCLVVNGKDRLVQSSEAERMLLTSIGQDPVAIEEKVKIIVSHFHERISHELAGSAKAMVVTSSRLAAFRYHRIMQKELQAQGLPYGCLVAFSSEVFEPLESDKYSEHQANGLPDGADIAEAFKADDQRFLIVANKYQTGFDQPLLNAMYLDKVLAGDISVVQTLSRLNRTSKGKTAPFILDFVNNAEDVQAGFEKYTGKVELTKYEGLAALTDVADILMSFKIYTAALVADINEEIAYRQNANQARLLDLLRTIDKSVQQLAPEYQAQFRSVNSKLVTQYDLATKVDTMPSEELKQLYNVCRLVKKRWVAKGTVGAAKDSLSVLIAELEVDEKLPFATVNPEAPFLTSIDGTVRVLSREEHEGILLSAFITDANAGLLRGGTAALYALLVRAVDEMSGDARVMAQAEDNAFDSFVKGTALAQFGKFLGKVQLKGPKEQSFLAVSLQGKTSDAKQLKDKAFRAVARCVFNRAAF